MKPLAACRLYAFIDTAYLAGRHPAELARQLCDGGADLIQLRAKGAPTDQVLHMAAEILPVTRASGVLFVINDHVEAARQAGADLVHLGQEDFFDAGFHHRTEHPGLAASIALGLSSHAPEQGRRAEAAGADYVAVGPVFATGTKPGRPACTLEYVRWAAAHLRVPWFAIGGINLQNLDEVLSAGATRVCVVSAILQARDVAGACREFRRRLGG